MNCPCCGSNKTKEYRINGVWALKCFDCKFDSAEHDPKLFRAKHEKKDKEK